MTNVAVLGGGHGAHTMAADLTLRGYGVRMYEMPIYERNIRKVLETKQIEISGDLPIQGVARLQEVTTDIEKAIDGAEYIFIPVPAYAHKGYAELLAKLVSKDQVIVLFPGTFGTLEMKKIFRELGNNEEMVIAEADTLPYATRLIEDGCVRVFKNLKKMGLAVFPARRTREIEKKLVGFFPFDSYRNVLECGLSSLNPVLHIGAVVLNIGRIEYTAKTTFYLYEQGYTKSTAKVCERVDEERRNIGRALGFELLSVSEALYRDGFGPRGTLWQTIKASEGLTPIAGPNSIDTRYLREDTPFGFVTWSGLGKQLGVETPTIDALIHIVSIVYDIDYFAEGRNLERLGLSGMDRDEMVSYVENG
jgi:opine dehydrogenase